MQTVPQAKAECAQNARRRTLVRRCLRADDQRWVVMQHQIDQLLRHRGRNAATLVFGKAVARDLDMFVLRRSEEHTSELQSLMRISYAVFCLKKKKIAKSDDTQETHIEKKHKE